MTAQIIAGKAIAQQVRDEVAANVAKRVAAGDRVDSVTYVSAKQKAS